MRTLSKSDFKLARTCSTKLYYQEEHFPQRTDDDPMLAMLAEGGYMVEQLGRLMYPEGIALQYGRDALVDSSETAAVLQRDSVTLFEATLLHGRRLARVDILRKAGNRFELIEIKSKSLKSELEEVDEGSGGKSAASPFRGSRNPNQILAVWQPYLEDVTYQVDVLRALFPDAVIVPYLLVVDTSRKCPWDRAPALFRVTRGASGPAGERDLEVEFTGDPRQVDPRQMLALRDVTAEVELLMPEVHQIASHLESLYRGDLVIREENPLAWSCSKCEFRVALDEPRNGFLECWQDYGRITPHIFDLWQFGQLAKREDGLPHRLIANRSLSLLDVPLEELGQPKPDGSGWAHRQVRQIQHTRSGVPYQDDRLLEQFAPLEWPLHFIDFEALQLAIPPFRGMRPYEKLPFQWSCHTVAAPGETPVHRQWLSGQETWCSAEFAGALRDAVGERGTLLTWSSYEGQVLRTVISQHDRCGTIPGPLLAWLNFAATRTGDGGRLFDMEKVCVRYFLHPAAGGRTSIKPLLDAIWKTDPVVRDRYLSWARAPIPVPAGLGPYEALPAEEHGERRVRNGVDAMNAFRTILFDREAGSDVMAGYREMLLRYCELDTLAMVLLWDYWRRSRSRPG